MSLLSEISRISSGPHVLTDESCSEQIEGEANTSSLLKVYSIIYVSGIR